MAWGGGETGMLSCRVKESWTCCSKSTSELGIEAAEGGKEGEKELSHRNTEKKRVLSIKL